MSVNDINPFFTIKKVREGDELKMDQKFIKIRMNSNKVMAIHYKAPMERTIELEMFFEDFNPIDSDYDYKILMLEEYKCPTKVELKNLKRSSKFRPNFTLADS